MQQDLEPLLALVGVLTAGLAVLVAFAHMALVHAEARRPSQ
ncbi:hypothetical protein EC608_031575 [Streptomyces malaysiensis subsp. malaysiensis]|nr:hypothetical protein [Streptomyces malaysiensis]